jgi:protein-S-isoprenylcysteine O-methyltransferase Ste14
VSAGLTQRRHGAGRLAALITRVLFVAAVTLLAARISGQLAAAADPAHLAGPLLMAAYLAWLILEVPVTFRAPRQPVAEGGTLAAYAGARMVLVISAVLPAAPWPRWSPWMLPWLAMFGSGVALRTLAIRALGAGYTHHVLRRDRHVIVTTGPYRLVRHPAYAGMLLANLGFVLFFRNAASLAAWLLLLAALVWRIRTEERVLWPVPGYPEFAAGRARLLPGVW